jgi:NAD(P)H-hydrate epimerase
VTAPELPKLPARDPHGHKGTFGLTVVVGGACEGAVTMLGGPALTAIAALRSGSGLVRLAMPAPLMTSALSFAPCATGVALPVTRDGAIDPSPAAEAIDVALRGCTCMAIGPGLGTGPAVEQVIARLLVREDLPIVLDADGLNAFADMPDAAGDLRAPAVLTPHPGEYRRLAATLELPDIDDSVERRRSGAEALARRLGAVVVLKGAGSIVTDGLSTTVNETGNAALATGGSGDVLTGIIAGLISQHFRPFAPPGTTLGLLDCVRVAVHAHGRVADVWADEHGTRGMVATDLLDGLPDALAALE